MSGSGTLLPPLPWAVAETLYPAGSNPWNGQPVMVPPVGDIFTPGTKPPARYFNYLFNNLYASILSTQTYVLLNGAVRACENWQPPSGLGVAKYNEAKPAWDAFNGAWLLGYNSGAAVGIVSFVGLSPSSLYGTDIAVPAWGGGGNFALQTFVGTITSVCKEGTDGVTYYLAVIATSTAAGHNIGDLYVYSFSSATNAFTQIFTTHAAASVITDAKLLSVGGRLVLAVASTTAGAAGVYTNPTPTNPATWTPISLLDCNTSWDLAYSGIGGQIVAVANSLTSTNEPSLLTSPDGVAWTGRSFGAVFSAGDKGVGVAWGWDPSKAPGVGAFLFCFTPSGTTHRRFLQSVDGIAWTTTDSLGTGLPTLTATAIWDLAAIGRVFVGMATDIASPPVVGMFVVYSTDGGLTWTRSQMVVPVTSTSNLLNLKLGSSGVQLAASYQPGAAGTQSYYAFSHIIDATGAVAT
jgi:hypothetical protein